MHRAPQELAQQQQNSKNKHDARQILLMGGHGKVVTGGSGQISIGYSQSSGISSNNNNSNNNHSNQYLMERSNSFSSYSPNGNSYPGGGGGGGSSIMNSMGSSSGSSIPGLEPMSSAYKQLVMCKAQSYGYFIEQPDSQYNPILPVLPRL